MLIMSLNISPFVIVASPICLIDLGIPFADDLCRLFSPHRATYTTSLALSMLAAITCFSCHVPTYLTNYLQVHHTKNVNSHASAQWAVRMVSPIQLLSPSIYLFFLSFSKSCASKVLNSSPTVDVLTL
ncbi:hypothetical protein F5Y08DRAFT_164173 [Xylaria arbuscula]|nr:hypothetical protein F5Y08DRAFT_164173 [Xylaria arbuscula]